MWFGVNCKLGSFLTLDPTFPFFRFILTAFILNLCKLDGEVSPSETVKHHFVMVLLSHKKKREDKNWWGLSNCLSLRGLCS